MGKVKKFAALSIRKITGGKDPKRLIEEFIVRLGFDPEECQKQKTPDSIRWMITIAEEEELEILLEGIKVPSETTCYMGINIITVPIRGVSDVLTAALQIADGLVGLKISLVGHYLVLSASMGAADINVDDLDYYYKLMTAQRTWFRETLADELGWEEVPQE